VNVVVPTGLSSEQKEILREFAAAGGTYQPEQNDQKKKRKKK